MLAIWERVAAGDGEAVEYAIGFEGVHQKVGIVDCCGVDTLRGGGILAAPKVMVLLYGPGFAKSGAIAATMVLACPLILLNTLYANLAIATNLKNRLSGSIRGNSGAHAGAGLLFGRGFGAMGVAAAIVIREGGMFGGFWMLMSRHPWATAEVGYLITS